MTEPPVEAEAVNATNNCSFSAVIGVRMVGADGTVAGVPGFVSEGVPLPIRLTALMKT